MIKRYHSLNTSPLITELWFCAKARLNLTILNIKSPNEFFRTWMSDILGDPCNSHLISIEFEIPADSVLYPLQGLLVPCGPVFASGLDTNIHGSTVSLPCLEKVVIQVVLTIL